VQRAAALLALVTGDRLGEVGDPLVGARGCEGREGSSGGPQPGGVLRAEPDLASHVEADEAQRGAGGQHHGGRIRVDPEVELARHGRHVGVLQVDPAHHHDLLDARGHPWLEGERQGHVGERPDRHQGQPAGLGHHPLDQVPGRVHDLAAGRVAARGHHGVRALRGPGVRPEQGSGRTPGHRDTVALQPAKEVEGQPGGAVDVGVAVHRGDQLEVDVRVRHRQREGEPVVDVRPRCAHAEVGVEQHALAHDGPVSGLPRGGRAR